MQETFFLWYCSLLSLRPLSALVHSLFWGATSYVDQSRCAEMRAPHSSTVPLSKDSRTIIVAVLLPYTSFPRGCKNSL